MVICGRQKCCSPVLPRIGRVTQNDASAPFSDNVNIASGGAVSGTKGITKATRTRGGKGAEQARVFSGAEVCAAFDGELQAPSSCPAPHGVICNPCVGANARSLSRLQSGLGTSPGILRHPGAMGATGSGFWAGGDFWRGRWSGLLETCRVCFSFEPSGKFAVQLRTEFTDRME